MREIVLDTETTGLDPQNGHRIVEIGAIEIINKVPTDKYFHSYVNPERSMPDEAYRVHGISAEFLQTKPMFKAVVDEFLEFIGSSKLVIHNAVFDVKFINYELSRLSYPSIDIGNTVDTLLIARKIFPGQRVNLDALCKMYKVDNSGRQFHGALKDAKLLAEVYIEMTGGRQESFDMQSSISQDHINRMNTTQTLSLSNFKVIFATEEEKEKHKDLINKLGLNNSLYISN